MSVFRWIPGYEGRYKVSDSGDVLSYVRRGNHGEPYAMHPVIDDHGYSWVVLYLPGLKKRWFVHRLVLLAFVGPSDDICRHLDGDPSNNSLGNLSYGSHKENSTDSVTHGTNRNARKTHCIRGHGLTSDNLIPSGLKSGRRGCLTCSREQAANRRREQGVKPRW